VFGRVPDPREAVDVEGLRIEVVSSSETQVTRARITRKIETPIGGETEDEPPTDREGP
jgi:CBS domain containing-hemolysin-like protein